MKLAQVFYAPGTANRAVNIADDFVYDAIHVVQGGIVEGKQVQVFAEAMMKVEGCQGGAPGQKKVLAGVSGKEALQERRL